MRPFRQQTIGRRQRGLVEHPGLGGGRFAVVDRKAAAQIPTALALMLIVDQDRSPEEIWMSRTK